MRGMSANNQNGVPLGRSIQREFESLNLEF